MYRDLSVSGARAERRACARACDKSKQGTEIVVDDATALGDLAELLPGEDGRHALGTLGDERALKRHVRLGHPLAHVLLRSHHLFDRFLHRRQT
jgi:hypothetical protein